MLPNVKLITYIFIDVFSNTVHIKTSGWNLRNILLLFGLLDIKGIFFVSVGCCMMFVGRTGLNMYSVIWD